MTNLEEIGHPAATMTVAPEGFGEPDQVLLVLAKPAILSGSLIHAIRRDFPSLRVEQREDVSGLFDTFAHPVSLILIEASLMHAAEAASAEILRLHPHAMVAALDRDEQIPARLPPAVLDSSLVRSVLPMNLRLDIWLAVVRLLLCGGEYFPPRMFRDRRNRSEQVHPSGIVGLASSDNGHLVELTAREMQVLEMVSRGLQNKSIAAALTLSEHTVKIHLHNIISKLGVHNRTEAAARFRNHSSAGLNGAMIVAT